MDDGGFGITYIIDNAQQFWSELEDILRIPGDLTLDQLDATMRQFVAFCASYHEQYLHMPMQMEHSCELLMASELFTFHSERMCELLLDDALKCTDPHRQLILYNIFLAYGRRKPHFLRMHKRWPSLFPLLMDHVRLELDLDLDNSYLGAPASGLAVASTPRGIAVPIEKKLRFISIQLLYEACRVRKLSMSDLRVFDDLFIEYLFDLVEETRGNEDETFNYAVIKLIVALNEQFMLASLEPRTPHSPHSEPSHEPQEYTLAKKPEDANRVLRILMARLSSSMTFGANLIFMLNRAKRTPEDLVMQLLVLKLLYLLFTTKGTANFFYSNDLCVLVDVVLREILDLDEENESLRHTYLRVLHPLLTKTQLSTRPYKRPQIMRTLESLIGNENIREVNPTTKRLVQRCLSGDWCVQLRQTSDHKPKMLDLERRVDSPGLHSISSASSSIHASGSGSLLSPAASGEPSGSKIKSLKSSKSHEHLKSAAAKPANSNERTLAETFRNNGSSLSLPRVAAAAAHVPAPRRRDRAGSMEVEVTGNSQNERRNTILDGETRLTQEPPSIAVQSPFSPNVQDMPESPISRLPPVPHSAHVASSLPASPIPSHSHRRAAPAPPPRRRKPPAIPTSKRANGGTTFTTIASSATSPLASSYT